MRYHDFVEKSKTQDSRNIFETCNSFSDFIPEPLRAFYLTSNPVNVEIMLKDYFQIKFYPISELENLQRDYDLPADSFCFATNNSDPIFIKDGKIFTMSHDGGTQHELLSDSFDEYLELLISQMR